MGQVVQFPSRMVFGVYGLSSKELVKGCGARRFSSGRTMQYARLLDSPPMRAMLEGELVIPQMTDDGLGFLMKDKTLDQAANRALAQAYCAAMETKDPHFLLFKIGSHHVPGIAYERDCLRGQEMVMHSTATSDEYYLKPGTVQAFKIYSLNTHRMTSKYPSFTLDDVTRKFA